MFKRWGFTLVEVLLVIVIIGVLAALILPRFAEVKGKAQKQVCRAHIATVNSQAELYKLETGTWVGWSAPDDNGEFWTNENIFPDGYPQCPVDGTNQQNYVFNTTKHRVILSQHLSAANHD